jgi:hypothetical protein
MLMYRGQRTVKSSLNHQQAIRAEVFMVEAGRAPLAALKLFAEILEPRVARAKLPMECTQA